MNLSVKLIKRKDQNKGNVRELSRAKVEAIETHEKDHCNGIGHSLTKKEKK